MARRHNDGPGDKRPPQQQPYPATWLDSLPVPEVREGGDSTWELWHEAKRELEAAFAPTEPSAPAPLSTGARSVEPPPARTPLGPLGADTLMVVARRNNRVCPQPALWTQLYHELGGPGADDLPPPPVERWLWSKLSSLQKRLFFREYLEWAERHGKLGRVAAFMERLGEADWLHMGER
jgi:hypothetical protein